MVIFWLLKLLRIYSSWSDLRSQVIDGKTQFLPAVGLFWLFGLGGN